MYFSIVNNGYAVSVRTQQKGQLGSTVANGITVLHSNDSYTARLRACRCAGTMFKHNTLRIVADGQLKVHSIPIFIVAALCCITAARLTDMLRHRFAFCIVGICVSTVGYGILLSQALVPVGARYAAIFLIVSGGYICQVRFFTFFPIERRMRCLSQCMRAMLTMSQARNAGLG